MGAGHVGSIPLILHKEQEVNEYIETQVIDNGFVGLGEFTLPSGLIKLLRPIFRASVNFGNLPLWIHAFNPLTLQDIQEIAQYAKEFPSVPTKCIWGVDMPYGYLQLSLDAVKKCVNDMKVANAVLGENIAGIIKIIKQ